MKKVKDTKTPTVRQLQNISENLSNHFRMYVHVSINFNFFSMENSFSDHNRIEYGVYLEYDKHGTHYLKSWNEFLQYYHKLMKMKREDL